MTQHFANPTVTDELAAVGVGAIVGTLSQMHWMLGQLCQQNRINIPQGFQSPALGLQASGMIGPPWGGPQAYVQAPQGLQAGQTNQPGVTEQGIGGQASTTRQTGQQASQGRQTSTTKRRRSGEGVDPAKRAAGLKGAAARAAKRQAVGQ